MIDDGGSDGPAADRDPAGGAPPALGTAASAGPNGQSGPEPGSGPGGPVPHGPSRVRLPFWRWHLHIPKFLRRGATVILLILIVEYLVIPKLTVAFSHKSLHTLERVSPLLIIFAFALEVVSLFAYAKFTVIALPPHALSLSKAWRINLASLTVSHVIPGGTAGGTGLSIRLMTAEGISGTDVGFATAIQGIGSAVLLNIMLWLAIVISIPFNGFEPAYVSVAIVSVLLLGFFAVVVAGFASGEGWAVRVLRRLAQRSHFIPPDKLERTVRHIAERLQAVAKNPELIRRGVAWAAANWLCDAACLYVCLWALHSAINPVDVLVAYGVGNVLAAIPITPGGLGITEGFTILLLTAFHVPTAIATLAVLGWRFFNFWLPIPVGAGCYLSLRVERGASLRERRAALSSITAVARSPLPDLDDKNKNKKENENQNKPDVKRPSSRPGAADPKAGPAVPPLA